MGLAAGEVLQGCAEGIGGKKADVNLHSAAHGKTHLVFAASDDVHQAGQLDDVINQFLPFFIVATSFPGYQDVEIADGFASAAQGSGGSDIFDAGISAHVLDDFPEIGR